MRAAMVCALRPGNAHWVCDFHWTLVIFPLHAFLQERLSLLNCLSCRRACACTESAPSVSARQQCTFARVYSLCLLQHGRERRAPGRCVGQLCDMGKQPRRTSCVQYACAMLCAVRCVWCSVAAPSDCGLMGFEDFDMCADHAQYVYALVVQRVLTRP